MLVEHEFDHENHIYKVKNEFCLATGDVIEMNGLSDLSMIPLEMVKHAGHRGSALHEAVMAYETGCDVGDTLSGYDQVNDTEVAEEAFERFRFYLRWRADHEVKIVGKMEEPRVYRHEGTGQLIGGTPDFPCEIDGEYFILDLKSSHKNYGQKGLQDHLKWKIQLQSYKEAIEAEFEEMDPARINKAILHLHPTCGKNGVKGEQSGFEFHHFQTDDAFILDGMIRVAVAKLAHGHKLIRR